VRAAGIPLQDGVRLILGCDEETGMTDMAYYKSKFAPPDYGFSPDAEFPVINIEKGRLELQLTQRAAGGGAYPIRSMHAGERVNVVPGVAEAEVALTGGDFANLDARVREASARLGHPIACEKIGDDGARITATGKSAHAAMAENGVNAAGLLLIALKEIGAGGGLNDAIGALADVIGLEYDGRSLGIQAEDEESGHLTCNLGVLRADGDGISAQLDIRYPICENEERLCGRAAMAISGTGLSLRRLGGHTPHHVPAEHKVVKGLIEVYSEVTGTPGYAFAIGGGTYSRCMPNTVAFGFNYPGDTDTCHMPDEYVDIEKLMMSVRIFARAIAKLAGGEA
ncbi:MAG: Sapep family Mn(2+)-dependent dipeptidase, partial [Christensenellales bacterium]|jgi:succinyl-diaminopimelate desuccinylase